MTTSISDWSRRVGQVFSVAPRDGAKEGAVWLPRERVESEIETNVALENVHVCVDGPTGSGKTSAILTALSRQQRPFVSVQVTQKMSWGQFSRAVASCLLGRRTKSTAEFTFGVDRGLPTTLARLYEEKLSSSERDSRDAIDEGDLCEVLRERGLVLFVDDFDRASDEVIQRVADMCKLTTQTYASPNTKLIVCGADEVYRRLLESNPSLQARVMQVSVGTFRNKTESWRFLALGLDALGLAHPWRSQYVTQRERAECVEYVFRAADGLPKSLNELGLEIGKRGWKRSGVTPADIRAISKEFPQKNFLRYRREFPDIFKQVESSQDVRDALRALYAAGMGHIQHVADLAVAGERPIAVSRLEAGLDVLEECRIIVRTGVARQVVFARDPTLAHTLGIVLRYPEEFDVPIDLYSQMRQMLLPFGSRADTSGEVRD